MDALERLGNTLPGIKKEWPVLSAFWKETAVGSVSTEVDRCDELMKLTPENVMSIFARSDLDTDHELVRNVIMRLRLWGSIK